MSAMSITGALRSARSRVICSALVMSVSVCLNAVLLLDGGENVLEVHPVIGHPVADELASRLAPSIKACMDWASTGAGSAAAHPIATTNTSMLSRRSVRFMSASPT